MSKQGSLCQVNNGGRVLSSNDELPNNLSFCRADLFPLVFGIAITLSILGLVSGCNQIFISNSHQIIPVEQCLGIRNHLLPLRMRWVIHVQRKTVQNPSIQSPLECQIASIIVFNGSMDFIGDWVYNKKSAVDFSMVDFKCPFSWNGHSNMDLGNYHEWDRTLSVICSL